MSFIKCTILLCGVVSLFCVNDNGIILPDNLENVKPLADFRGKAVNEGGVAITTERLLKVRNPQVGLIWQFLGLTRFTNSLSSGSVKTELPFTFSGTFRDPPPSEVYTSNEVALGYFILFSDANDNMKFDEPVHPELQKKNIIADSLSSAYYTQLMALWDICENINSPFDCRDTFLIHSDGTIAHQSGTVFDTIGNDSKEWQAMISYRCQILGKETKWDLFFSNRKRTVPRYMEIQNVSNGIIRAVVSFKCKIVPASNRKTEFYHTLKTATRALFEAQRYSENLTRDAYVRGTVDYPYNGLDENRDWIVGRSRWYQVIYFPDRKSIDEITRAERYSSFIVEGKEHLNPGYNLIFLDDQYRCRVLSWSDSIQIDLGTSELYFNKPTRLRYPISDFTEVMPTSVLMPAFEGVYDYLPYKKCTLLMVDSSLWADIDGVGAFKLQAADSMLFYSADLNMQIQVVYFSSQVEKVLLYLNGHRYVCPPIDVPGLIELKRAEISARISSKPYTIDSSLISLYSKSYDYGLDTIRISPLQNKLSISIPNTVQMEWIPSNDTTFYNLQTDLTLQFSKTNNGKVREVLLKNTYKTIHAPSFDYTPLTPQDIFNIPPTGLKTLLDFNGGSGVESVLNNYGIPKFSVPSDSFFIRKGDGIVTYLGATSMDDDITIGGAGSRVVFKITDQKDKIIGLQLHLRCDRTSKKGRLRFYAKGSPDTLNISTIIADNNWVNISADSNTIVTVDPVSIPSDIYFIEVGTVQTADPSIKVAVDSYFMGTY
jgi:hypothetical protein